MLQIRRLIISLPPALHLNHIFFIPLRSVLVIVLLALRLLFLPLWANKLAGWSLICLPVVAVTQPVVPAPSLPLWWGLQHPHQNVCSLVTGQNN